MVKVLYVHTIQPEPLISSISVAYGGFMPKYDTPVLGQRSKYIMYCICKL